MKKLKNVLKLLQRLFEKCLCQLTILTLRQRLDNHVEEKSTHQTVLLQL